MLHDLPSPVACVVYERLLELALVALLDDYVARDGYVVTHDVIDDILRAVMT